MAEELWRAHSFDKSKDSDGGTTTSGSFTYWEDAPVTRYEIGDPFQPVGPQGPTLKVTKISVSDNVIGMKNGKPFRQWQITVEGDASGDGTGDSSVKTKYTIEEYKDDNGVTYRKGSIIAVNEGDSPTFEARIGDTLNIPVNGWGGLKCTRVSGGDEYTEKGVRRWTMTFEGAGIPQEGGEGGGLPSDQENNESYEINGLTTRSVGGDFVVLQRSGTPVIKKSITEYHDDKTLVAKPGTEYSGGVVTAYRITKETIKENGVSLKEYYRHDIEIES